MNTTDRYIPALRYRALTPLYDPFVKRLMREQVFKRKLIDQARLEPGMHLLDLGCGTGTLTLMIKHMHPQVQVTGLDGDPQILHIAQKKVAQAGLDITLDLGMAYELPYEKGYFDRVVSSMVFHHLSREAKQRALGEIWRVLRPGGEFHMVDFGVPANTYARLTSMVMRNFEDVEDNIQGRIIGYIRSAGFAQVGEAGRSDTFAGTLMFYRAEK